MEKIYFSRSQQISATLHDVTFQKTIIFTVIDFITSNLAILLLFVDMNEFLARDGPAPKNEGNADTLVPVRDF
jgi:hypothetical protein